MFRILCFVLSVSAIVDYVLSEAAINQDSYLNALQTSHQQNSGAATDTGSGVEREDYDYHHDYNAGGYDYHPIPPKPVYGPPPPVYGPPKPVYGPPHHPPPIYGPPHHPPPYYHPRETWLLDKFKFKLDLFTIGKILLKLIIFKKIVKFIALICLLLFLPKLHHGKDEEESGSEESRRSLTDKENLNARINEATNFALTAFKTFSEKYQGCERGQIWCRFERMFDTIDAKYPYSKIVKLYLPDTDITTNEVATE